MQMAINDSVCVIRFACHLSSYYGKHGYLVPKSFPALG